MCDNPWPTVEVRVRVRDRVRVRVRARARARARVRVRVSVRVRVRVSVRVSVRATVRVRRLRVAQLAERLPQHRCPRPRRPARSTVAQVRVRVRPLP